MMDYYQLVVLLEASKRLEENAIHQPNQGELFVLGKDILNFCMVQSKVHNLFIKLMDLIDQAITISEKNQFYSNFIDFNTTLNNYLAYVKLQHLSLYPSKFGVNNQESQITNQESQIINNSASNLLEDNMSNLPPTPIFIHNLYNYNKQKYIMARSILVKDDIPVVQIQLYYDRRGTPSLFLHGFYNSFSNPSKFWDNWNTSQRQTWEEWQEHINQYPELREYFSGLACGLLEAVLIIGTKQKWWSGENYIGLDASGSKPVNSNLSDLENAVNKANQLKLVDYYSKLGFNANEDYLNRYKLAFNDPELQRLLENPDNNTNMNWAYPLEQQYEIKINQVPMEAKVESVIQALQTNCAQHIGIKNVKIENLEKNMKKK